MELAANQTPDALMKRTSNPALGTNAFWQK